MSLTINIYYTGKNGSAKQFAKEMISSGLVDQVRSELGNKRYEYFFPENDPETVLLIDCWENREALDLHHKSPMMAQIAELRDKYNLNMMLEATNVGVDNIWIEMFNKQELKKQFHLEEKIEPICLIPIGYKADDYKGNPSHNNRKNLKDIVEFI